MAYSVDTFFYFAFFVVKTSYAKPRDLEPFVMAPVVVFGSLMVWSLAARLDWVWGGAGGWMIVGVRRRKTSHAERASERLDWNFGWKARCLTSFLAFLLYNNLLPVLPSLVASSPFPNPHLSPVSLDYIHLPDSTSLTRFIKPVHQTSQLMVFLAQSLLSSRSKSFRGGYRIVAYLLFASSVLKGLPVVLCGWWGAWELMPSWRVEDAIEIGVRGFSVVQALRWRRVEQDEGEEDQ